MQKRQYGKQPSSASRPGPVGAPKQAAPPRAPIKQPDLNFAPTTFGIKATQQHHQARSEILLNELNHRQLDTKKQAINSAAM